MRYLKIILTVIAILLTLNIAKEYIPESLQADSIMRVDIVRVNGRFIYGDSVPVIID